MRKIPTYTYQCEICNTEYQDPCSAQSCETQPIDPKPDLKINGVYMCMGDPTNTKYIILDMRLNNLHTWEVLVYTEAAGDYWVDYCRAEYWIEQPSRGA